MANSKRSQTQANLINPNYAWLERTRKFLNQMGMNSDIIGLKSIISEGNERLKTLQTGDTLLEAYLRLMVAEAQINLAFEMKGQEDILKGITKGKRLCEKVAQVALVESCGTACTVLPRTITLLAAAYNAIPDPRQSELTKSLQKMSSQLDDALIEQKVLREKAAELQEQAHLLLASFEGLTLEDRKNLIAQSVKKLLRAGDLYAEAGDLDRVVQVQGDLEAVQISFEDPKVPQPQLDIFDEKVLKDDLLPDISSDLSDDYFETEETPSFVNTDNASPRKRGSGLKWVISIIGMLISCIMTLYSGYNLVSNFGGPEQPTEESIQSIQTQNALTLTQMAISNPQESSAQAINPVETQAVAPAAEVINSGLVLTGQQLVTNHSIFDDFSSKAFHWLEREDNSAVLRYEDEAYHFQVIEPGFSATADFPVSFIPYGIDFTVKGVKGQEDGTFGVFCQIQDEKNYYYVEIDRLTEKFVVSQVVDGEYIPLTPENASGQFWQDAPMLKLPVTAENQIGVTCYLDFISLFINDELAADVDVIQPFNQPGKAAFFVYAYDFVGEEGYSVLFDNVEIWQPVQ